MSWETPADDTPSHAEASRTARRKPKHLKIEASESYEAYAENSKTLKTWLVWDWWTHSLRLPGADLDQAGCLAAKDNHRLALSCWRCRSDCDQPGKQVGELGSLRHEPEPAAEAHITRQGRYMAGKSILDGHDL
jgi:hypothetical protein